MPGVTGRFAPSPTGPLHLGSLRTALVAWLLARSAPGGGRFLLRVEDLDPDRSRREWEALQIRQLTELGLDWDGPVVRQSERLGLYRDALSVLAGLGRVYPCFCTRAEIRAAVSAPHEPPGSYETGASREKGGSCEAGGSGETGGSREGPAAGLPAGAYPGTCRRLSRAERAARITRGNRHALRFDAGAARVSFTDGIAGQRTVMVDDFVLRRSDGAFAYQLAVVVDDFAQGITQVVRGADLLDSVGRQALLMAALGYPEPDWVHVPLVLGPDGRRLAKRHGAAGAPASPRDTLARLAASLGLAPTPGGLRDARDLLPAFDLAQIPRRPAALPA